MRFRADIVMRKPAARLLILFLALFLGESMVAHANPSRKVERKVSRPVLQGISPSDSLRFDYFFLQAVSEQNAGHYDAAFDLLNHCVSINPHAAEAYFMRALYLSELKRDTLALDDLQKAASLRPDNDTYLERLAQFYLNGQNYDKATDAYEKTLCGSF